MKTNRILETKPVETTGAAAGAAGEAKSGQAAAPPQTASAPTPPATGAKPTALSAPAPEDPRLGLPSASRLEQLQLCPGSARAQQGLADPPREDAESGRRIHHWLAGHPTALTAAELDTAHACRAQQAQLLARFTASQPAAEPGESAGCVPANKPNRKPGTLLQNESPDTTEAHADTVDITDAVGVSDDLSKLTLKADLAGPAMNTGETDSKPGTLLPEGTENAAYSKAISIASTIASPYNEGASSLKPSPRGCPSKACRTNSPAKGRSASIKPGTLSALPSARRVAAAAVDYVEQRFWLLDDARRAVMSGQADWVAIRGRRALIVDFKTGHGAVTASPRNPQLMALAVMLAGERPELEEILTAIIQPAVSEAPLCAVYDRLALAHARAAILRTLADARAAGAPLVAGPHQCQYCRAKTQCPAARELIGALAAPASLEPLANPQLAQLLARCGAAEQAIAALRAEARRRLESGQDIPGWRLKPGAWRERVLDARAVFTRLAPWGVSAAEFTALCAVTKTALKTLLQEKAGLRGAALEAALASVLEGLTETKPTAPTLVQG